MDTAGKGIKYSLDKPDVVKMPGTWPVGVDQGLQLLQLHLHWGDSRENGAEHHLFSTQYQVDVRVFVFVCLSVCPYGCNPPQFHSYGCTFLIVSISQGELHLVTRNLDQNNPESDDYYAVFGIFLEEVDKVSICFGK